MNKLLAATIEYPPISGPGEIGQPGVDPVSRLAVILSGVIGFITLGAVIYFIFRMMLAGYGWMTAGGDSQKVQNAQNTMWRNALGLAIVLLTMVFVNLIGYLLGGVDLLNLDWLGRLF